MVWQRFVSWVSIGIILYIQARRLIVVGCSAYVAHVTSETLIVESVPVVCKFPDVFLVDFPGLPP